MVPAKDTPTAAGDTAPPADSGLRCPTCGYNLTGLDASRCPECGGSVDIERLRRYRDGDAAPIPSWDDPARGLLSRFFSTCLLTWLHPVRFAEMLPRNVDRRSIGRYRRTALLMTWLVVVLTVVLGITITPPKILLCAISMIAGVTAAIIVSEGVLAAFCEALLEPRQPPGSSEASALFWLTTVQLYRGFIILPAGLILVSALAERAGPGFYLHATVMGLLIVASLAWWWVCLGRHLATVSRRGPHLVLQHA